MSDYRPQNTQLLSWCLEHLERPLLNGQSQPSTIQACLQLAFKKAIKVHSQRPVPPLYALLLAEDLGSGDTAWAKQLSVACAYFYTAADLLDDIQDKDPNQPVLHKVSSEQALNIYNFLLMGAYQVILELDLQQDRQLALVQMFTHMGQTMSLGQFGDIYATNRTAKDTDPEQVARAKAGAEFACFLSCVPCALGLDFGIYAQLGEELGTQLQVLTDYFDIWMVPNKQSLSQDLLVLKNSFPLHWARQDAEWGSEIDLALAGQNHLPEKQFHLRRLLSQSSSIEAFESFLEQTQARLRSLFDSLPALPHIQYLCDSDHEQARQLLSGLKELKQITKTQSWKPTTDPHAVIQMAIDYLNFIPEFRDVWEVQRWGFLDQNPLWGDIFNPLLVLEALAACDQEITEPLMTILHKQAEDGWHYYSNTEQIPTDSDDLGQILQLAASLPAEEVTGLLKNPLELLLRNLEPSGLCPTWLCDESKHRHEEIQHKWFGNKCLAVMANLYYGLFCYDARLYAPQIEQGIDYLLSQYDPHLPGWQAVYYSSQKYTAYLIARLVTKYRPKHPHLLSVSEDLTRQQLLDGSWQQSPQETAFALLFLCEVPVNSASSACLNRAFTFLLETQLFDGSWPGENLFIRPGKQAHYEFFAHPKLTSTFCLRALAKAQKILF